MTRSASTSPSLPRPRFELVSRLEVATTRPALERARYACECCRGDSGLRVVSGYRYPMLKKEIVIMVLCADCREGDGFAMVVAARRT